VEGEKTYSPQVASRLLLTVIQEGEPMETMDVSILRAVAWSEEETIKQLEKIIAKEREACAKIADAAYLPHRIEWNKAASQIADDIRGRGEQ
jgi:hypothetical protein